jgi:hypothetical protein
MISNSVEEHNMVSKAENLQTEAMITATYNFVADFFPRNTFNFDVLWREVFQGDSLQRLRTIVKERERPRTPRDTLVREYSAPNVEQASWSTLSVLFRLHDKLRRIKREIGLEAIRNLLDDCAVEVGIPRWLHGRIITHLPAIVLHEFSDRQLIETSRDTEKPYVVYCGEDLPYDCDAAQLAKYRKIQQKSPFDIFIDDVMPNKLVQVKGEPGKFTPGRGLPYRIMKYLLSRVGREVSYTEIRNKMWSAQQCRETSGLSKIIHDKLDAIRRQLKRSAGVSEDEPDRWFQKTSVRGVVYVSKDLNSCLITTSSSISPKKD